MSKEKRNSQEEHVNPIDAFLNQDQANEISSQQSVEQEVFDVNADDLAHAPKHTSQQHSYDDTHETLTKSCFDQDDLLSSAGEASKKN